MKDIAELETRMREAGGIIQKPVPKKKAYKSDVDWEQKQIDKRILIAGFLNVLIKIAEMDECSRITKIEELHSERGMLNDVFEKIPTEFTGLDKEQTFEQIFGVNLHTDNGLVNFARQINQGVVNFKINKYGRDHVESYSRGITGIHASQAKVNGKNYLQIYFEYYDPKILKSKDKEDLVEQAKEVYENFRDNILPELEEGNEPEGFEIGGIYNTEKPAEKPVEDEDDFDEDQE